MKFNKLFAISLCLTGSALSYQAHAQAKSDNWPEQTVKTIVAFSPGGTTDIIAREVGNELGQLWQQSVVVENKPGAGGNIGIQSLINEKADGYSILMSSNGPITMNPHLYRKKNFDTLKDIRPIIMVANVPNVLVVSSDLGINSVEQLSKLIEENPGKYNCASTGVGTAAHLSCELMSKTKNLDITHVPYKGADALNDVIAGRVHFIFATLPSVMGQIKVGKLLPLAVSTDKRSPALADVPTMQEAGFKDFSLGAWFGYFAPANTPDAVVNKMNQDIEKVIHTARLEQKLLNEGAEPAGGSASQFAEFIQAEYDKWGEFIKELNISL
ncbi:tripartite tricarboxylate transporter substrate binding protein [Advenella sp. WQ 585]|uniref:Tripartite tricarboxylate transporter substrate binding protein n=1 Tax=Advenella mandrilli TaxID=2800330 RepID=A0ABS1E8T3_9BURK|nr:tripartite tricarboxylate transporter substrate binding protein [Advenella mandrilli]MBK1780097.1 tripartite tricarboxylate transporter substrate binding protein [Advenella mandrilli]